MTDIMPDAGEQRTTTDPIEYLQEKFPGAFELDTREGYEGIVVENDSLVELGQAMRDDLGSDLLSNAAAVDYLEDGYLEVGYHAYNTRRGGPPINVKARTQLDDRGIPSLVSEWRGTC